MTMLLERVQSETEDQQSGGQLLYKIVSYPTDFTLQILFEKWNSREITIPKFQRGWVWKHPQASKLVDSFLLGLPVPSIFLYKEPSQKYLVIDGHQRLLAICSFFDGILPDGKEFYLTGVSPQWEGKFFKDLREPDKRRLRDSVLRAVIVEQLDPKDTSSMYHIFERLNTGGTTLTPQEVRNCVYHGPFNEHLVKLNNDPNWRSIMGTPKPDKRMRDIELLVRFLALSERGDQYTKPMKEFVSNFMGSHQNDADVKEYEAIFETTVKKVALALDSRPFHIRQRGLNAAAFDCVMVAFAKAASVPGDIKARYSKLLPNPSFVAATTAGTTDVDTVKSRLKLAREVLFQ